MDDVKRVEVCERAEALVRDGADSREGEVGLHARGGNVISVGGTEVVNTEGVGVEAVGLHARRSDVISVGGTEVVNTEGGGGPYSREGEVGLHAR